MCIELLENKIVESQKKEAEQSNFTDGMKSALLELKSFKQKRKEGE